MKTLMTIAITSLALPAFADGTRELDSHEHGVSQLNIAIEGSMVAMELIAPGADIVGFEYRARNEEDRKNIEAALATLERPLDLFDIPPAAECRVQETHAALDGDEDHHDHEGHDHSHSHENAHDDDHDKDDAGHTEFHAEYSLICETPNALKSIRFNYFDVFEHARELEIQIVTSSGAKAVDVMRDAPTLDLDDLF